MSQDMSTAYQEVVFSDRKQQILQKAIGIIASEGYGKLTMRGLARASDMKLGALQYHFRTWGDMLAALVAYIANTYRQSFEAMKLDAEVLSLRDVIKFTFDDSPGSAWLDVVETQTLALRLRDSLILNKDRLQGEKEILVAARGRKVHLQFALFAIPQSQ